MTPETQHPCAAAPLVLWGSHPRYANGTPIKLAAGTFADCTAAGARRTAEGDWLLSIYGAGVAPVGLRLLAAAS